MLGLASAGGSPQHHAQSRAAYDALNFPYGGSPQHRNRTYVCSLAITIATIAEPIAPCLSLYVSSKHILLIFPPASQFALIESKCLDYTNVWFLFQSPTIEIEQADHL